MFNLPGVFGTLANLAVIIIGFGSIIFVHELGHFLAAKWAGIRVLAFSMGMGPVVCSYRKGIGLRKGSTDPEYRRIMQAIADGADPRKPDDLSPTEYRFSALPLGGYVKMLGQEDANPGAVSDAPDSYQQCPVPKRMVVICAGVVMNLIMAAVLFVVVFMVGLRVQPPIVGQVAGDSPAAAALPVGRDDLPPGLLPEDVILEVGGRSMRAFNEVVTEVAMSGRHHPVRLLVQRPGHDTPIEFEARAREDRASGLLDLGIAPAPSGTLASAPDEAERARFAQLAGLGGLSPGDRLVRVQNTPAHRPSALLRAAEESAGAPITAEFESPDGATRSITIAPQRRLQTGVVRVAGERSVVEHVLGLRPLMQVDPTAPAEMARQGLQPGDIILRIGDVDAPSTPEAIAAIRANAGKSLQLGILRANEEMTLQVDVSRQGMIGFVPAGTASVSSLVAAPVALSPLPESPDADPLPPERTPAADLIDRPGTRIASVAGVPIATLRDVPGAIVQATAAEFDHGAETFQLQVGLVLPLPAQPDGRPPIEERLWTLTRADVQAVRDLGWSLPMGESTVFLFEMEQTVDKAATPFGAVVRGIAKSRQVMNQTYLTFLRLFQGTVKVSHLKGPVGIAHLGTQVADQGFIWVLFFLGLVSVNLAVINFLPLPIVDGGQFLMLCYEGIRRRPVPIVFQNVATLAGLALIGTVFLIVTFHDIKALLGV